MANSIQNKRTSQTYLRQVQQEQAQKKRELMSQQNEDLRSLRQFYAEESKKIDEESSATVNHIKSESNAMAQQERNEQLQNKIAERQAKIEQAEQSRAERSAERRASAAGQGEASAASEKRSTTANGSDAQAVYNRKGQRSPLIQNYASKENDDFYRVQNRGSRVSENNQGYVIEAYAPEHEKDNLRVSIQRNKAVVSGQRKFNDEAQEGNKKMRTNNFQTFREEFQFDRPVSHEGMTRERIGDYVRFTIPKLEAIENPDEET